MIENDDEIEIQHRELIEEENIDISELPTDIKNEMRKFNAKLSKYEETEDVNLFYELQQDDVAIANDILTWVEDNEAEEEEEEDDSYLEEDDDDEEEEEEIRQQSQARQPQVTQANGGMVSGIEQKIRSVIKNNVISVENLQSILGREPEYPFEQVGNLKLKKQYLKPYYEVA